ncbi:hypothetical protein FRC17_005904 [Serendipita sp. 399]|nr:hypothetical protein FRC17_005904 [Serendipita sp. 399]
MFKLAVLAAALAAAPVAFGQSTSTAIPECITTCIANSFPVSGCDRIDNIPCLCQSQEFRDVTNGCVIQACNDLLPQAVALQAAQCAAISSGTESTPAETGTGTGSASGSASTSRLVSSAVSSASTAAPTTSRPNAGFEGASIASSAAVALFGAALALF